MEESAWARARRDAGRFRQDSVLWFWGVEVIGVVVFAGIGAWLTPEQPSKLESTLYPGFGLIAGFVVAFLSMFGWNLFKAPYRQRDEARALLKAKPKSVFLPNRDMLLRTIAEAKLATVDEAENIENIKLMIIGNVVFRDADMWDKLARIKQRFDWACESLEREVFTAGDVLEPILKPLLVYMRSAAELDASTVSNYKVKLEQMVKIARDKIDELSQPVTDRENFQK